MNNKTARQTGGQGTIIYNSPEMITRNENKEIRYSNKIDIWAAGMTLYEMMCLEYPIEAANDREWLNSIAKCKNFW